MADRWLRCRLFDLQAGSSPGQVLVEDGCREGSPTGKLKTVEGIGTITDAKTTKAKMRVRYPLFNLQLLGALQFADKTWFISATPDMENLWIYSRSVPSKAKLAVMVRKAKELGYDTSKLEFPEFDVANCGAALHCSLGWSEGRFRGPGLWQMV